MMFDFRLFWRMSVRSFWHSAGTYGPLKPDRFLFLLFFYPIWGCLLLLGWIGFLADEVLFAAYRKQPIEKPLFIVSNFRSGSTFVQRTLARDSATFSSVTTGGIYLTPSITQHRVGQLLAQLDRFLGRPFEKWIRQLDRLSLGQLRIHHFGLFDPEEDEHFLFYAWSTLLAVFAFPYLEELPPYAFFDQAIPKGRRDRIMRFYLSCVRRHLYANGGRHYLAKNPLFSAKIESLLETFPDARILYLVRSPLETLPSTISMFAYLWGLFSKKPEKYPHCEAILGWAKYWYDHPLEVIDRDTSGRCLIMRYEDLIRSPDEAFRAIYSAFGYPETENLTGILRDAVSSARNHTSDHEYSLEAMGLDRERILKEFAHIFARFQLSDESERRPAPVREDHKT